MRIATLYDIHGNLPALDAVLNDIAHEQIDLIIVGGDVIAGPMPVETLERLQHLKTPTHFIHGNAESELLAYLAEGRAGGLSARADEIAQWVAQKLTPDHIAFISRWSSTHTLEISKLGTVLFCHATPHNDIDIFTQLTPAEKLRPIFANLTETVVICGHTHIPFERTSHSVRIINGGSVGMPFGKTGADWLLLGSTGITFKHTDYDTAKAADRIRQTDYPDAEGFATNNVIQPPTEAEALAFLTQLEAKQAATV